MELVKMFSFTNKTRRKMIRSIYSKIVAVVLIFSLVIILVPSSISKVDVIADVTKNHNNTCLGTSGIASPVAPADKDSAWQGSYVYFGNYNGNPIKFRVLAPSTSVYGGTTMFLDSEYILFNVNSNHELKRFYTQVMSFLNDDFLTETFTIPENEAIAISAGDGGVSSFLLSPGSSRIDGPYEVSSKVFLLDVGEIIDPSYGYSNDSGIYTYDHWGHNVNNRIKFDSDNNSANSWMLRNYYTLQAPSTYVLDSCVSTDGSLSSGAMGVAPALNIDLDRVLFSTSISGNLGAVGSEYTLTVLNDDITVSHSAVSISDSTMTCVAAGNGDQVSILITDGVWDDSESSIMYYGEYTGSFDYSLAGLDISDWGTSYHVYLIAEDNNGIYETDYASVPVELSVTDVGDIVSMFRLYNPNSGEHFYTSSEEERDMLIEVGWNFEGIGWVAPAISNTPVYRLYNQYGGEHHYTTSIEERDVLIDSTIPTNLRIITTILLLKLKMITSFLSVGRLKELAGTV